MTVQSPRCVMPNLVGWYFGSLQSASIDDYYHTIDYFFFQREEFPISIKPTEIQSIWIQIGKERREAGKPDDADINREPKQRLNQTNQRGCLTWNQN